jgi:hypothetical protein
MAKAEPSDERHRRSNAEQRKAKAQRRRATHSNGSAGRSHATRGIGKGKEERFVEMKCIGMAQRSLAERRQSGELLRRPEHCIGIA